MSSAGLFIGIGDRVLRQRTEFGRPFAVRNSEILYHFVQTSYSHTQILTTSGDVVPTVRHVLDYISEMQRGAESLFLYISSSVRVCGDDIRLFMWDSDSRAPQATYLALDDIVSACEVPTVVVLDVVYEAPDVAFPTGYCNSYDSSRIQFVVSSSRDRGPSLALRILEELFSKGSVYPSDFTDTCLRFPAKRVAGDLCAIVAKGTITATMCDAVLQLSLPLPKPCPRGEKLEMELRPAQLLSLWMDYDMCSLILHVAPEGLTEVSEWIHSLGLYGVILRRRIGMHWLLTVPKEKRDLILNQAPATVLMIRWVISVTLRLTLPHWAWMEAYCRERALVNDTECVYEAITLPSRMRSEGPGVEERLVDLERYRVEALNHRRDENSGILTSIDELAAEIRQAGQRLEDIESHSVPSKIEWERGIAGIKSAAQDMAPMVDRLARRCDEQSKTIQGMESTLQDLRKDRELMLTQHRSEIENLRALTIERVKDIEKAYATRSQSDVQVLRNIEEHSERQLQSLSLQISSTLGNIVDRMQRVEATVAPVDSLSTSLHEFASFAKSVKGGVEQLMGDHEGLVRELREVSRLAASLEGLASGGTNTFLRPAVQDLIAREVHAVLEHGQAEQRSHFSFLERELMHLQGRIDEAITRVTDPDLTSRAGAQLALSAHQITAMKRQIDDMAAAIASHHSSLTYTDVAQCVAKAQSDAGTMLKSLARTTEEIAGALVVARSSQEEIAAQVIKHDTGRDVLTSQVQGSMQRGFQHILEQCEERISKAERNTATEIHGLADIVGAKVDHHQAAANLLEQTASLQKFVDSSFDSVSKNVIKLTDDVRRELINIRESANNQSSMKDSSGDVDELRYKVKGLAEDAAQCARDIKANNSRVSDVSLAVAKMKGFVERQEGHSVGMRKMEERVEALEELGRKLSKRAF